MFWGKYYSQSKGHYFTSSMNRGRLFFMSEQVQKNEAARGLMRYGPLLSEPFIQVQLDRFESLTVQKLSLDQFPLNQQMLRYWSHSSPGVLGNNVE
jgi:hypothetical protein